MSENKIHPYEDGGSIIETITEVLPLANNLDTHLPNTEEVLQVKGVPLKKPRKKAFLSSKRGSSYLGFGSLSTRTSGFSGITSRNGSTFISAKTRFTGLHLIPQNSFQADPKGAVIEKFVPKFKDIDVENRFHNEKKLHNLYAAKNWFDCLIVLKAVTICLDYVYKPGPWVVIYLRTIVMLIALFVTSGARLFLYRNQEKFVNYYSVMVLGVFFVETISLNVWHHRRSLQLSGYTLHAVAHGKYEPICEQANSTNVPYFTCQKGVMNSESSLLLLLTILVVTVSHFLGLKPIQTAFATMISFICYSVTTAVMRIQVYNADTVLFFVICAISLVGSISNEFRLRQIFERSLLANKAFHHNRKLRASFDRHIENEQLLMEQTRTLEKENEKLRQHQNKITSFRTVDLESPLMQSLKLLSSLQDEAQAKGNMQMYEQMKQISKILAKSGNDLTSINIAAQVEGASVDLDDVTRDWLNTTTSTWQKKRVRDRHQHQQLGKRTLDDSQYGARFSLMHQVSRKNMQTLNGSMTSEIQEILSHIHEWNNFDVFKLADVCSQPISAVMQKVFEVRNLHKILPVSTSRLMQFTMHLDSHYSYQQTLETDTDKANAYHNNIHAADVLQSVKCILFCGEGFDMLSPPDELALYIAAAIHDFRHIGRTNQFLVETAHPIAIQHNDQSVLERFHLAEAFKLISKDEFNLFKLLPKDQRLEIRQTIVDLVLATDLAQTTEYMSKFQLFIAKMKNGNNSILKLKSWKRSTISKSLSSSYENEDALLMMQIAIKVADIGHPSKPLELHKLWSMLIQQEFFEQGDVERGCGMKVAPMCDRNQTDLNKGQLGFIDFVCRPLIEPFSNHIAFPELMTNLSSNYKFWQTQSRNNVPIDTPSNVEGMTTIAEALNSEDQG